MFMNNNNTMLPPYQNQINNYNYYLCKCLKSLLTFLLVISMTIILLILYCLMPIYVVVIFNELVIDSDYDDDKCSSSKLYEYALLSIFPLVCLILIINNISANFSEDISYNDIIKNIINNKKSLFMILIINLLNVLWGFFEFYNVNCVNNLHDTILYKYSFGSFIYSIIISIFIIILLVISIHSHFIITNQTYIQIN